MKQRHYIIITAAAAPSANATCHTLGIDPEGKLDSFVRGLVPIDGDDDAEPTHYVADGQLPETLWSILANMQSTFPGTLWWRVKDTAWGVGEIVATNTEDELGSSFDFISKLAELNLRYKPYFVDGN